MIYTVAGVAAALHVAWAVLILLNLETLNSTAVHALYVLLPHPYALATMLVLASFSALVGAISPLPQALILLMPQQTLLLISAMGCIEAMLQGHFADGVERAREFIIGDQLNSVLLFAAHSAAVIMTGLEQDNA
jgi:hypothetical protein